MVSEPKAINGPSDPGFMGEGVNLRVPMNSPMPEPKNEQVKIKKRRKYRVKTIEEINGQVLLSVSDAAKVFGFSRWVVNDMCRKFELRWVPRGKKGRRIPRTELDRWIKEHTVSNQEQLRKALDGRRSP